MAIALQNAPVTGSKNASGTLVISVTVNAGTDRILVVCAQMEVNSRAISGVTFGAAALTKLDSQAAAGAFSRCEIWYLINPAVSTANVTISYSPDGADVKIAGVYVLTGVHQTTPWRTAVKQTGASGTSSSLTVASVVTGDFLIDSLDVDGTGHAVTPGANQTEQWDLSPVANSTEGVSDTQAGVDGGVMSHTWTTAAPFTHVADALIASGGATLAIAGTVNATSTLSGNVVRTRPLSGTINATSTLSGAVVRLRRLAGTINSTSALSGAVVAGGVRQIAGTINASSTLSGTLSALRGVSGSITATSTLSGTLVRTRPLSGTINATSDLSGGIGGTTPPPAGVTQIFYRVWTVETDEADLIRR